MHDYSQADLKRLFRLTPGLVRALANAGYITATASEGKTSYSFQDLLVLRMASALKAAKLTATQITTALGKIRATLPPGSVLTTMALAASGKDVALRLGPVEWEANSGQYTLPLSATRLAHIASLASTPKATPMALAEVHYLKGHALEDSDVTAARAAYLDALKAHSDHLEARVNLGRLLHLAGDLKDAEKVYRQAKSSSALLSFNLAILLEDLDREEEAAAIYREALAQDPHLGDAHFNLARLHEKAQRPRDALKHLLAYRRLIATTVR